ncbi:Uncharacterized mitochondrial protein AtMg00860, partial [Striga hermonthica]
PRFSNSEESEKSQEILIHDGLLLEVNFNLGESKQLQVQQVDIRRDKEGPINSNRSCHDEIELSIQGCMTQEEKDVMPESRYIGRSRRVGIIDNLEAVNEEPEISMHAMAGIRGPRTMRLPAWVKDRRVIVLVDNGSSHNFINADLSQKLNLPTTKIEPFDVRVANGERLQCTESFWKVPIKFNGATVEADLYALPLVGPDVVLEVQWLEGLGKVTTDYQTRIMEFNSGGQQVTLSTGNEKGTKEVGLKSTEKLLEEFEGVLGEPKGLPPHREFDHRIPLINEQHAIHVHSYRYAHFQKTEIERQVVEMLESGLIQHSNSPFSSPVLLAKKKDGTWRFCTDYRALNAATIKDRFPIPSVDNMLDELAGSRYFSKLDLRAGYHQIRLHKADIPKTAFRTHHGHYEYLVMPFGLCNAPSTFQFAMNSIFKEYLRKFVLVFFDDILIYSKSWGEHLEHLRVVLKILEANSFHIKPSKCSFGQKMVEYLGHFISHEGVKVDPRKIEAMIDWPKSTSLTQLRGFLGLTGYYRKFVKDYGTIAKPLTEMTKKDGFTWTEASEEAFGKLKVAMTTTPVLAMP